MELWALVVGCAFMWLLFCLGCAAIEDFYAKMRRKSRERITRLDGPYKLILLAGLFFTGCATANKMIVLENMPRTIVINRGEKAAAEMCQVKNAWGCALREPEYDRCTIALNWYRGIGTDLHEFAHCAGADEEEAQSLVYPE